MPDVPVVEAFVRDVERHLEDWLLFLLAVMQLLLKLFSLLRMLRLYFCSQTPELALLIFNRNPIGYP